MKIKFTFAAAFAALIAFSAVAQNDKTQETQQAQTGKTGNSTPIAEHYPGGDAAMQEFIQKELKYPLLAKRNRIQGRCIIGVTLNADGTLSNFKIIKNIGGGCGEEALRVVKLMKFNAPGYDVLSNIPVDFKL